MKYRAISFWLLMFVLIGLSSCMDREHPAPVEESTWRPFSLSQKTYTVRKGDTLYAVAFTYDRDYRDLAAYNHLSSPYALKIGQQLRLTPARSPLKKRPSKPTRIPPRKKQRSYQPYHNGRLSWIWPVKGRISEQFIPSQRKKGITIAGQRGDKIRAASSGVVAYAGDGLVGYGNLIIIKHNSEYLTAYGNNSKNLVKEGQKVKQGQVIADMGRVARRYYGVHFEVRKNGKPVNPLNFLQKG